MGPCSARTTQEAPHCYMKYEWSLLYTIDGTHFRTKTSSTDLVHFFLVYWSDRNFQLSRIPVHGAAVVLQDHDVAKWHGYSHIYRRRNINERKTPCRLEPQCKGATLHMTLNPRFYSYSSLLIGYWPHPLPGNLPRALSSVASTRRDLALNPLKPTLLFHPPAPLSYRSRPSPFSKQDTRGNL